MNDASMPAAPGRRAELAANLAALRARIAVACAGAGRDPAEVTVIAVTKTWPASDVRLLAGLGLTDIGENRDAEAARKAAQCADLPLTWHFVGQLQTNKCRSVVRYAHVVHSVDRPHLVEALGRAALGARRRITCLVQVNLGEPGGTGAAAGGPGVGPGAAGVGPELAAVHRGGARPDDVAAVARQVAAQEWLRLGGVMAVAPLGAPPGPAFRLLAAIAADVRAAYPQATMISAGMTGDLEEAIEAGSTHVRVGTALLGARRPFVR